MTSSKYCYKVRGKHGVKTVQKWRVSFFLDGKRYQRSGFATKKEARDAEQKLREQIANMVQATRFDDLCADYLDHSRAYNTSEYARDKELRISTKLIPMFEGLSIQQITSDMIGRVILAIAKHRGPVTANRDLVLLKSIFNHAIERDLLEKNPCNKIKPLPVQHKKQSLPSADDINRVLACLIPDRRDMVQIIMGTMARGIEVISRLTWDDINFKDRTVTLYTRKSRDSKLRPQIKPMTGAVYQILLQRLATVNKKSKYVFEHEGKPYVRDSRWLYRACLRARVKPFGLHALRHFTASTLDSANIPLADIQSMLGHQNIRTTAIYVHQTRDLSKSVETLDRLAQIVAQRPKNNTAANGKNGR